MVCVVVGESYMLTFGHLGPTYVDDQKIVDRRSITTTAGVYYIYVHTYTFNLAPLALSIAFST